MTKNENKSEKKAQDIRNKFENNILSLLVGMGEVVITKGEYTSYIIKDNIIFGKIIDNVVYLIDPDSNEYKIVPSKLLENKDDFLMQATRTYFHVRQEHKNFVTV